jgi:hypothetical protein
MMAVFQEKRRDVYFKMVMIWKMNVRWRESLIIVSRKSNPGKMLFHD